MRWYLLVFFMLYAHEKKRSDEVEARLLALATFSVAPALALVCLFDRFIRRIDYPDGLREAAILYLLTVVINYVVFFKSIGQQRLHALVASEGGGGMRKVAAVFGFLALFLGGSIAYLANS